jgi:hypothetical protein
MGSMDAMRRKVQVIGFGGRRERRFAATVSGTAGAPAAAPRRAAGWRARLAAARRFRQRRRVGGGVRLRETRIDRYGRGLGTTGCGGGGTGAVVSGADGCGSCGAKSWRESPPFGGASGGGWNSGGGMSGGRSPAWPCGSAQPNNRRCNPKSNWMRALRLVDAWWVSARSSTNVVR